MPSAQAFDPRLIEVSLDVNGQTITYSDLAITIIGTKFANALQNECTITIVNLNRDEQEYILTETSPFTLNHTPKVITVMAGRASYGMFKVYSGNIVTSTVSQPPDIGVSISCLTGNFQNGNILSRGQPAQIDLFTVSKQLAQDYGTSLTFQATNRTITNFFYSGAASKIMTGLNSLGGINIFLDDGNLIVKNALTPLDGAPTLVSLETGMIGIPELTEQGVRVKFLLDNSTRLGGGIQVVSIKNPAANGLYVIYKLGFEIATRDTPFYWIAEAARQR